MELTLNSSIQYLKGVGEKRAELYKKLHITTISELFGHYPRGYIDVSKPYLISEAPLGALVPIRATIVKRGKEQTIRKGFSLSKVTVTDDVTSMIITFYNAKYTVENLKDGEEYIFYGKLTGNLLKREMTAPHVFNITHTESFIPIYSLTAGLSSKMIETNISYAFSNLSEKIAEPLPSYIRSKNNLCHIDYAINQIHTPTDELSLQIAKKRLVYNELFVLALAMGLSKKDKQKSKVSKLKPISLEEFYNALPFKLTDGQQIAINEATKDMCSGTPMNRLIQGDVGSGKTAVAAACGYFAVRNGMQVAMMAPTEILAEQHFTSLSTLLEPLGIKVSLLTGSMTAKNKRLVKEALISGECDFCVGTHALLSDDTAFKALGLVITDEQHRFGVAQRTALSEKGKDAHTLVMSATPIPRTLSLIVYGDLDISIIKELPSGRIPIKTYTIDSPKRTRAFDFFKKHINEGYQGYIVCPLIETGEVDMGLTSATTYFEELSDKFFAGYKLGLLHGKMKANEKEKVMRAFYNNEIQLLISTTVIEVGVDVPNAVLMMIENAERFGLSQLHQLRGRVGRGKIQSYCILLSDNDGEDAQKRLKIMCQTSSGFTIAEEDLKLRGPGDFLGYRQHGLPEMKIADMGNDIELLKSAAEDAKELLKLDPTLSKPEHKELQILITEMFKTFGMGLN